MPDSLRSWTGGETASTSITPDPPGGASTTYRALGQVVTQGWPRTAESCYFLVGGEIRGRVGSRGEDSKTHHIIHDTSTIVASLKALKKRMSSSPSEPSFFRATPNTRAKRTNPRMFIPSISVPNGICRIRVDTGSKFTTYDCKDAFALCLHQAETLYPEWEKVCIFFNLKWFRKSRGRKVKGEMECKATESQQKFHLVANSKSCSKTARIEAESSELPVTGYIQVEVGQTITSKGGL